MNADERFQVVCPSVQPSLSQVVDSSVLPHKSLKAVFSPRTVPTADNGVKYEHFLSDKQGGPSDAYHDPSIPYVCGIRPGSHENDFWGLIHEGLYSAVIIFLAKTGLAKVAQDWNTEKLAIVWDDLTNSTVDGSIAVNFACGRTYTLGCLEISKTGLIERSEEEVFRAKILV